MRLLLLLVLALPLVSGASLYIDVSTPVYEEFEIAVWHNDIKTYPYCDVTVDGSVATGFFSLNPEEIQLFEVTASVGEHTILGICSSDANGTEILVDEVSVIVEEAGEEYVPPPNTTSNTTTNTTSNVTENTTTSEEIPPPPPEPEVPPPEPQVESSPPFEESPAPVEEGNGLWYIIIGIVVLVLLGGSVGYYAWAHKLDPSFFSDLANKTRHLFQKDDLDPAKAKEITEFIQKERKKGFDDLTIRSTLISNGWKKETVDKAFDNVYGGT